jgi:cysteine-S-conjugate beta-lyase
MIYNFDQIIDRTHTESAKWNEYGKDVLPMWVADMDFVSPEPVVRALQERVAHGVFGYPSELAGLRDVLIEHFQRLYHWTVKAEEILFVPGVVSGFNLVCQALTGPGTGVYMQTPVYMPFLTAPGNAGADRQESQLVCDARGNYSIDWDTFEAGMTAETKLFMLCNPHNPVGRVYSQSELERMAEVCMRRGVMICSDEIHCDLLYSGYNHIPIASLSPEVAQNTITLLAPSKTFNMPGLFCSIAIIQNPELRKRFLKAKRGLMGEVNVLGLTAAKAAYQDGQEWLTQMLTYLEGNRDFLYETIKNELPMLTMTKTEGTYLAWIDCRRAGIDGTPKDTFLKKAKVALTDGAAFGKGGEGFVRLNFGCPRSLLADALERMKCVLQG